MCTIIEVGNITFTIDQPFCLISMTLKAGEGVCDGASIEGINDGSESIGVNMGCVVLYDKVLPE